MLNSTIQDFAQQLITHCPACQGAQPVDRLEIIEQKADHFLLRISCRHCSSALLAKVQVMPNGLFGSALVTDLEAGEIRRFRTQNPVSVDHALSAHVLTNEAWSKFINS